jgi:hypothetical protein
MHLDARHELKGACICLWSIRRRCAFRNGQQPQGRFKPAPQGRVPGNLHLLQRAKARGRAMVPELFRWFGWRRPY